MSYEREWEFDRYRHGIKMAQGARVNAATEEDALVKAKQLFHEEPNSVFTVRLTQPTPPPRCRECSNPQFAPIHDTAPWAITVGTHEFKEELRVSGERRKRVKPDLPGYAKRKTSDRRKAGNLSGDS